MVLFVNKPLFWWSASITLDNNNDVLTDFLPFFLLYLLPHTSVGLTSCIYIIFFSLKIVDPYDQYAACCVPLKVDVGDHCSATWCIVIFISKNILKQDYLLTMLLV